MEIVPWVFTNPYVDTRALRARELTFVGEQLVIAQRCGRRTCRWIVLLVPVVPRRG